MSNEPSADEVLDQGHPRNPIRSTGFHAITDLGFSSELKSTQPIPLEHQLVMCEQISALIQSGMPIERGLHLIIGQLPKRISQTVEQIASKLESGQTLSRVIATDARPSSRSLSATFKAGLEGNCLSQSLRSWVLIHTNQGRSMSRLRIALIYPIILVFVAASSIGFTIQHSIPLYRTMLESTRQPLPAWFDTLSVIHSTLWVWIVIFILVALISIFIYYRRQSNAFSKGAPLSRPYRLRLQSHANKIMAWLLVADRSFETSQQLAIESTGVTTTQANFCNERNWHPISNETRSVLDATARGELGVSEVYGALMDLADLMNRQADLISERQLRWFPIVASVAIATVSITTYILVVYLPWVKLLTKLSLP